MALYCYHPSFYYSFCLAKISTIKNLILELYSRLYYSLQCLLSYDSNIDRYLSKHKNWVHKIYYVIHFLMHIFIHSQVIHTSYEYTIESIFGEIKKTSLELNLLFRNQCFDYSFQWTYSIDFKLLLRWFDSTIRWYE